MTGDEMRNAAILRRTLSYVSWLFAGWTGLLAATALSARGKVALDARLLLLHAAILGLAGLFLWKPRRGARAATLLAAAGSVYFVAVDLRSHNFEAAIVDGSYVVLAAVLLYKSRLST